MSEDKSIRLEDITSDLPTMWKAYEKSLPGDQSSKMVADYSMGGCYYHLLGERIIGPTLSEVRLTFTTTSWTGRRTDERRLRLRFYHGSLEHANYELEPVRMEHDKVSYASSIACSQDAQEVVDYAIESLCPGQARALANYICAESERTAPIGIEGIIAQR